MFRRRPPLHPDLSNRLRSEVRLWNVTPQSSRIDIITDACTVCVDVPAQLFAVGKLNPMSSPLIVFGFNISTTHRNFSGGNQSVQRTIQGDNSEHSKVLWCQAAAIC